MPRAGSPPWALLYGQAGDPSDSNAGRLLRAERDTLDAAHPVATTTVVYDVPLTTAGGGPHDMTAAGVAAWGQTDAPTDAAAVFPPDQVPASNTGAQLAYSRAQVHYLDVNGRQVNTAAPGGGITTTEYDPFGNTVRELSAANRALALAAGCATSLQAGWTLDRIQEDFPFIEAEDVREALQYAAASAEVTMLPLQESA